LFPESQETYDGIAQQKDRMSAEKTILLAAIPLNPKEKHECYKRYCKICNQNKEVEHLCFMATLQDLVQPNNRVLYVFYDFETYRINAIARMQQCTPPIWSLFSNFVRNVTE
jgi:hypothetical protein